MKHHRRKNEDPLTSTLLVQCNDSERMARKRMKAAKGQEDRTTQTGKRDL